MAVTVAPLAEGDAQELLRRGLREADVREAWKTAGMPPDRALAFSLAHSLFAASIRLDGRICALLGVGCADALLHTGIPWMVAHQELETPAIAVPVARIIKRFVTHWLTVFPRLENCADPAHTNALRTLQWAGFTLETGIAAGPLGHHLVRFWQNSRARKNTNHERNDPCV